MTKKYRDPKWLLKHYVELNKTMKTMATELGVSHQTIHRWMKKHGIERRSSGPGHVEQLRDETWLRRKWDDEHKTAAEIAAVCDCSDSTVRYWLWKHGIVEKGNGYRARSKRLEDPVWLKQQNHELCKSQKEIASQIGCDPVSVSHAFKKHGIETNWDVQQKFGKENPNWRGGKADYGKGWNEKKRKAVRMRDGKTCQDGSCDMTQKEHLETFSQRLHVHHLIKAKDIDDPEERNAMSNLVTLCKRCHHRWEKISCAGIKPQIET